MCLPLKWSCYLTPTLSSSGHHYASGCDMTTPDFSGMSPFHLAIEEGASNGLAEALRFMQKEIHQYPDPQVWKSLVVL